MAITIECQTEKVVSVEEYVDYVSSHVDLNDLESMAESAPMLRGLANNRDLVTEIFNRNIEHYLSGEKLDMYTPQSFIIATNQSKNKNFYVRGNVWTIVSEKSNMRALEERVFSYNIAHDHDFSFMTVGYWGSGYETRIYECENSDNIQGYIGEPVAMRLLEQTKLPVGKIMLYRPFRDIHIQLPPEELSISLNLMVSDPIRDGREQYFYDVDKGVIAGFPHENYAFSRCSIIQLAGYIGNADTVNLLVDIAETDDNPRSRVIALDGVMRLAPAASLSLLEQAASAQEPMVQTFANAALHSRDRSSELQDVRNKLGLGLRKEISTLARPPLAETLKA